MAMHTYNWYESGNLMAVSVYKHSLHISFVTYADSPDKKIVSQVVYPRIRNKKKSTYVQIIRFDNGQIKDSVILDSKSREELMRYEFNEEGKCILVKIDLPDFVVFDYYNIDGTPRSLDRKVLYKGKWYMYKQSFYDNGQEWKLTEEKQFFVLHPEYGTMPDSLSDPGRGFHQEGSPSYFCYTLATGEYNEWGYRIGGTLQSKMVISTAGVRLRIEYDEQGNIIRREESIEPKQK
jgi:hypothetical protein